MAPPRKPRVSKRNKDQHINNAQPPPVSRAPRQGVSSLPVVVRTGIPRVRSKRDRIIVSNSEIALEVNGTVANGVIPAAGAIRVFRFENVDTGNNMNNKQWISKIAQAYDKFKIRKLNLRWVTSAPFTFGGQVALRWDSDPSKTTADAGLTAVSGDMRALATAVYNTTSNRVMYDQLNRLPQYETYPTAGDTGVGTVGSINLAHSPIVPSQGVTGTINIGFVWMDYEIEFYNPNAKVN